MKEETLRFILRGSVHKEGKKFGCEVTLSTPDLKRKTTINSGFIYSSSKEAKKALNEKIEEIQSEFAKDPNVVMIDKKEGTYTDGMH